jgi:hypothetical protein
MTYGPPPEQNASSAHPHAQQQWTDPHGRGWPGGPAPVNPPKGPWLAVAALILGIAGCGVWMLPYNLDTLRAYSPLPFGLLGIVLAVVGCIGPRRGKPLAVIGWILSFIALTLAAIMIAPRLT